MLTGCVTDEPSTLKFPVVDNDNGLILPVVYAGAAVVTEPIAIVPVLAPKAVDGVIFDLATVASKASADVFKFVPAFAVTVPTTVALRFAAVTCVTAVVEPDCKVGVFVANETGCVAWKNAPLTGCVTPLPSILKEPVTVVERGLVVPVVYVGAAVVVAAVA